MMEPTIVGALLVGLLASSHCLAMCGGLSVALGLGAGGGNKAHLFSYSLGRVFIYTAIGALAGVMGEQVTASLPAVGIALRLLAALLLVAMGLYISGWWMGLSKLEAVGALFFKRLRPLSRGLIPVRGHPQALCLGMLWGLLPCGLVYSSVAWALATADWRQSAVLMAAFGVGTVPAMLSVGLAGQKLQRLLKHRRFRLLSGLLVITMGFATALMPLRHLHEPQHAHSGVANHATAPATTAVTTAVTTATPHQHNVAAGGVQ